MRRMIIRLFAIIFLVSGFAFPAWAEKRVALVIGNSSYTHATALPNPSNDAADMAAALTRLGFEVVAGIDLDKSAMRRTIRKFSTALEGADVALFFYAGHGLQVNGKNYLAPVNAQIKTESDLDFDMVDLNLVLRQMERQKSTNLVFLDACRDNPLLKDLARSMGALISSTTCRLSAKPRSTPIASPMAARNKHVRNSSRCSPKVILVSSNRSLSNGSGMVASKRD